MRMSSGPSAWNEKPRSGSSSCIEETPMSSTTPSTRRDALLARRPRPARRTALRRASAGRRTPSLSALRAANRARIAVEREHAAVRGFENGARIAAGAERCRRCRFRRRAGRGSRGLPRAARGCGAAVSGSVGVAPGRPRRAVIPVLPRRRRPPTEERRFPAPKSLRVWWTFSRARSRRSAKRPGSHI